MQDGRSTDASQDMIDLTAMWRLRVFEETVRELRLAGDVVGSVHLGIGQEAVAVGAVAPLGPQDAVFATYRGHNWAIALSVPPERLFAELLGRESGINGGRGGSAYFTAPEYRFYGENSIVGAATPIAVGAALAGRYDGTGRVALVVIGDGAMNQGAVHEAMNFAAAMNLPVIFLCENNQWSEMTAIADMVRDDNLFRRAAAYGMPGERLDGNDPSIVRARIRDGFELAREGGGPSLFEVTTARLVGHYIGDAEQYRKPGELETARENEPIARLQARLRAAGAPDDDIDNAERRAREEMKRAVETALAQSRADPASVLDHLYA